MTNHVYEKASETAKKIRKTLKKAFPGIKFSVTSSTFSMGSSVDVHWTNGPLTPDVDSILNRFKPGYLWEGRTYMGANFIDSSRTVEGDRKKVIESWMQENGSLNKYGQYGVSEWGAAERELIQAGELQGYPSQLPAVEVPQDSDPENPMTHVARVIPFPLRSPEDITRRNAEQIMS
ncbi:hypothetical protein J7E73_29265 [Paenibacillus albidus]|nr:hypothetical protein [Paenibacillus albidus]